MKTLGSYSLIFALAFAGAITGCSTESTKTVDVTDSVRASLDKAGYKDVSVKQNRDKGVVTLSGHVAQEADKAQAEALAKSLAGAQVVANEIAVLPPGVESEAKTINSDLDTGIEKNLHAALVQARLDDAVKISVKNRVVTLSGSVDSQAKRTHAQDVATAVVNVQQVVNELQVKGQKATSSM
ncbi:BON domain-containing protein [Paludibaculum fermentans]|uniref:BON domain-containing protein n=1 Tax=Paludibaculum fermentans TaxID=1473598 RepID=A0A7S7NS23_PALFE|nr:BON domain-containing protein [Paludibaculum fermentans]QOY88790.1 BON domain-containing protein [Paludibaculum fermentans]